MTSSRWDRYWIGITIGLLIPMLFILLYLDQFNYWFLFRIGRSGFPILSKICLLSIFINMALIFVFYTLDVWRLSKGVLIGSFPYMIASVALTI